ncbi:MAG: transposase [Patescibacteria group bacterium]
MNNRQSIRLKGYDYSQEGVYHITICAEHKKCLFGDVINGEMKLNDMGKMIEQQWMDLPNRFSNIELDTYVIMPNHIHGIIIVNPIRERAGTRPAPTIANIVGTFKSFSMNEYIRNVKHANWPSFDQKIWQRNFYEQIIRNIASLYQIREYILQNPQNWKTDKLFIA